MPNRILKDSICTSPNIDALSREAEVFFYRLLVQCDDYGRMDARAPILRAKCYPLQIDTVTQDDVKRWLGELVRADLVMLYRVNGGEYLQMRTWERHQQIRAKRSKYPDMIAIDINCNHVIADAPGIQSNPIRGEANAAPDGAPPEDSEPETPPEPLPPEPPKNGYFGQKRPMRPERVTADGYAKDAAKAGVDAATYRAMFDVLIDTAGWRALVENGDDNRLNFAKKDALTLIQIGAAKNEEQVRALVDAFIATHPKKARDPRNIAEYASQLQQRGATATAGVPTVVSVKKPEVNAWQI